MNLQIKRFKDIVAFKEGAQSPIAFHSSNMEVAEITEELWNLMPSTSLQSSFVPTQTESVTLATSQSPSDPSAFHDLTTGTDLEGALEQLKTWQDSENPDVQSGALEFGIKSLTINVTQICNLHCTYCAAGGDGSFGDSMKRISVEKTLPQIEFFMNRLKTGDRFHISFLGGEPLIYPEALRIIGEYATELAKQKSLNLSMKVTTNGTLINDAIFKTLNDLKINIVVSLDGPPEINDRVRPQKNKQPVTEKIASNIRWLLQQRNLSATEGAEKNFHLGIHGVFNQNNMEVETAYDYYRELGADWYEFTYAVDEKSAGLSLQPQDNSLSARFITGMKNIAEKALRQGGEAELRKILTFDQYFKALDLQKRTENHCGIGKNLLIVDARNRLYNCPWTVGKAEDQMGQGQELFTQQFEEYQKPLIERNNCGNCWAKYICGGGCSLVHQNKTGLKTNKDEDFCFRTRSLISLGILYYKHMREENYVKETH